MRFLTSPAVVLWAAARMPKSDVGDAIAKGAEDLALLTVLLAAAGFLLTLAHALDPVVLLVAAVVVATGSRLAPGAPAPRAWLQTG